MREIDYHLCRQSLTGVMEECGDTGTVMIRGRECFLALVDALGHGSRAREIAVLAEEYFLGHGDDGPAEIIRGLHKHLEMTRGAVAAACRLHLDTGLLRYCGIGNISLRIFGSRPRKLNFREGILGYMIPPAIEKQEKLEPGEILILASDGIREHYEPAEYPDILMGNARQIAESFMKKLRKEIDDASCIALRYRP